MLVQNVSVSGSTFSKSKQRFKFRSTNATEYNVALDKYENCIKQVYASIIGLDYTPSKDEFKKMVLKKINGTDPNNKSLRCGTKD